MVEHWELMIKIAVGITMTGGLIATVGGLYFKTRPSCEADKKECQGSFGEILKEIQGQRAIDKKEAIEKREEYQTKVFDAIDANKDTVTAHYIEVQKSIVGITTTISLLQQSIGQSIKTLDNKFNKLNGRTGFLKDKE